MIKTEAKEITCQIECLEQIKEHVYCVQISEISGQPFSFFAGQYLSINMPKRDQPSFFSIASRPGLETIDLHIQADPHLEAAVELIDYLKCSTRVSISIPFGQACLREIPACPVILLAAGTGFAQMKSIVEHLQAHHYAHSISLYWGGRKQDDMYMKSIAEAWEAQHDTFQLIPVIANIEDNQSVEHHSQMADAVLAGHSDLAHSLVFVSGSPKLVHSAMEVLLKAGLPERQIFSDVLEYESNEKTDSNSRG